MASDERAADDATRVRAISARERADASYDWTFNPARKRADAAYNGTSHAARK
jgi:hypothetical protein